MRDDWQFYMLLGIAVGVTALLLPEPRRIVVLAPCGHPAPCLVCPCG